MKPILVDGKLSLNAWAKKAGVKVTTLNRYWNGSRNPLHAPYNILHALAIAIGLSTDDCAGLLSDASRANRVLSLFPGARDQVNAFSRGETVPERRGKKPGRKPKPKRRPRPPEVLEPMSEPSKDNTTT